jgi:tight adherence protein C
MNSVLLPLAAAALVFAAILVLSLSFVGRQDRERVRRSLALVLREGPRGIADVDERDREWIWPVRSQLLMVGNRLIGDRTRTRLRRHLAWAGTPTNEALVSMIERKAMLLIAGICVGLILGMAYGGTFWVAVPGLGLAGFFLPDLLVFNAGQARTNEIEMGLPDALDLLDLCVSSGLGLEAALSRIAGAQAGPVAIEFGRVLQEMQLGVSRSAAFESMAMRTKQQDLQRFVVAVLQVDKLGIPIAAVLKEQARDMRAKRHSRAREKAQRVPVKILLPLMLCFLPGLFIIILGPGIIIALNVFSGR